MKKTDQKISNTTEVLDGNHYENCQFENCEVAYNGGAIPQISNCHFSNCRWKFGEAAERTVNFMRQVYHGMGPGGVEVIEATFKALRQPAV